MDNKSFEAWLDEEWPVRKGPFDESVPISTSIKNDSYRTGARAAWAKAQEEINKMVLEKLKFHVTPQLMAHEDAERYKQQADKLRTERDQLLALVNDMKEHLEHSIHRGDFTPNGSQEGWAKMLIKRATAIRSKRSE